MLSVSSPRPSRALPCRVERIGFSVSEVSLLTSRGRSTIRDYVRKSYVAAVQISPGLRVLLDQDWQLLLANTEGYQRPSEGGLAALKRALEKFDYLSKHEVAVLLGVCDATIATLLKRGDLPGERHEMDRWRIDTGVLYQWVFERRSPATWEVLR